MSKVNLVWNLIFNGNCREAFRFYEKCLGGKINIMMTWGESPMAKAVPADWADKITHVSMTIGDQELTGGDSPGSGDRKAQGFHVILNVETPIEAERLFHTLAEGGTVTMPLQETFGASRYAVLMDRFGTPWMINNGKQG